MFKKSSLFCATLIAATSLLASNGAHAQSQIIGAGATFINPIMQRWIAGYQAETGVSINYAAIGSGGGITGLIAHTVDFAASDIPMNATEKSQAGAPVQDFPDAIGAVVVAYNVPGILAGLHFSGPVLADIFLGKITSWSDPAIAKLNPGVKFPNQDILVIHRSDGSGTSAIFTEYLSKVSGSWADGPGTGKSINWPVGLGGKGNPGVTGFLQNHPFSIGYVELAYAINNHLFYSAIQNKAGSYIYPTEDSASKAAVGIKVPASLEISITNSPNPEAYPIAGMSNLIVYKSAPKNAAVAKFFKWVFTTGQSATYTAPDHYSPLPEGVATACIAATSKLK